MGGPPYILNYMEEGKRKKKLTDSARKRSHVSANKQYRARKALISGNIKLPVSIMNRSSDGKPKHCSSASQMRILQKLCLTCTIAGILQGGPRTPKTMSPSRTKYPSSTPISRFDAENTTDETGGYRPTECSP
ncbi:uncharacterized protein LOC117288214 [Asterias rubens]|uniref:uncharacterized protein LOC117288214 n=1 Tax=Asterias rubens TaxID=7604 RepID=UPI0014557481|nr:uncharacterized protein LOC117288214 [Asterias rubens]